MTHFPKIWFLRHGQTTWNLEGRIQGRLNSDLTEQGMAHAHAQARLIAPFLDSVANGQGGFFVSPQGRARQTAEIALNGRPFEVDDSLAEISAGAWEGRLQREVTALTVDLEIFAAAPGGEGIPALEARVRDFLQALKGPSVIVSHGILGKVMRGVICGLDSRQMGALCNQQGAVYVLDRGRESVLPLT